MVGIEFQVIKRNESNCGKMFTVRQNFKNRLRIGFKVTGNFITMRICFICLLSIANKWNINNFNREPRKVINIYRTTVICYIQDNVNFFSIYTVVIYGLNNVC